MSLPVLLIETSVLVFAAERVMESELPAGHCFDLDCFPQYLRNAMFDGAVAVKVFIFR